MRQLLPLTWPLVGLAVLLGACSKESTSSTGTIRAEPLVVYADYNDETYLPGLFAGFTEQTGIRVTVRHADAKVIVTDVIGDTGSPPADVLLAPTVSGIWAAADEGALRPLRSNTIISRVPAALRDPDGAWIAVSYRIAVFLHNTQSVDAAMLDNYESLADEKFRGKLCLSSSALSINRTLIAMLIDDAGIRPAEIMVRGWIANLALPVFETEQDLANAIAAGSCGVGIVSSSWLHGGTGDDRNSPLSTVAPSLAYADIEGIGIARHARQPEVATQFIEWLLSADVQAEHQRNTNTVSANSTVADTSPHTGNLSGRNVGIAAQRDEEATKLAHRAAYR